VTVIPGNSYVVTVGASGAGGNGGNGVVGGDSAFALGTPAVEVVAKGGAGGGISALLIGAGGQGSAVSGIGDVVYRGGHGSAGLLGCSILSLGGAGGGGAGSGGAGGDALLNMAGTGTAVGGGSGGAGLTAGGVGNAGTAAGGGGAGGCASTGQDRNGGAGGSGMVAISYVAAPTVTTNAATAVTISGATLNGTVSSNLATTTVTFDYGLTTGYGSTVTATTSPLADTAVNAAVSASVTGLICGTTYHFRAKGVNSAGTTNGNDLTFAAGACGMVTPASGGGAIASNTAPGCSAEGTWTALTGPTLTEGAGGEIGADTIVLSAPAGFEFNTAATVTVLLTGTFPANRNINNAASGTSMAVTSITATAITFTVTAVSISANSLTWQGIQVRPTAATPLASGNLTHTGASAITGVTTGVTSFGALTEVTSTPECLLTTPAAPTVTTNAATAVTTSGATLNGTVSSNLATTTVTFDYGLTASYGSTVTASSSPLAGTAVDAAVSASLTGLTCGTAYHFRAVGVNAAGTTNGNDLTFTTSACPAESFVFTNGACSNGVLIGAPGCTRVTWSPPLVAGQALSNIYITFVDSAGVATELHPTQSRARSMQFRLSCHDPIANAGVQATFSATAEALPLCQGGGALPTVWTTGVDLSFAGGSPSVGPYSFNYADVGKVELWMRNSAATAEQGYSGVFTVKPAGFVLSNIRRTSDSAANPAAADAIGATFVKAGEAFGVTVTATAIDGVTPTPNYGKEVAPEGVGLTANLVAPAGGSNPALGNGAIAGGEFGGGGMAIDANGVATVNNLSWSEVGIVTLTPSVADGSYLGGGNVVGTTTGNVGRFYPDHFDTAMKVFMPCPSRPGADSACPSSRDSFYVWTDADAVWTYSDAAARIAATGFVASDIGKIARQSDDNTYWELTDIALTWAVALAGKGFIYSGQPFSVQVTARSLLGNTTVNYDNTSTFSKAATLTAWGALGSSTTQNPGPGALAGDAVAAAAFAAGVATAVTPTYTFTAANTAPTDIFVRASDTDGVTSLRTVPADSVEGGVKVASGRIKVTNAYGSELLPLTLIATVRYYDGAVWTKSNTDSATTLTSPTSSTTYSVGTGATAVTITPASGTMSGGSLSIQLGKPNPAGSSGKVTVTPTIATPYLQIIPGTATFGVYKGRNEFIYQRENY
jgi:hypothetical protein